MTLSSSQLRSVSSLKAERRQNVLARYGGFYWGADFLGFSVATFFTVLFLGIVGAAVGAVGYQFGAKVPKNGSLTGATQTVAIGGVIAALVAIFLAYLIGGYAAGRMARFDGIKNGIGVVIWTIVVAIILGVVGGIVGNKFQPTSQLHLKIDTTTLTTGGIVSIVVTIIVMLGAAALGGWLGTRFHEGIDSEAGIR